jgi:hypothetical protein
MMWMVSASLMGKLESFPLSNELLHREQAVCDPVGGTIITRPVPVNKERYRDFLVNKVVPAIKVKWGDESELEHCNSARWCGSAYQ